jgi:hypothetical protein
MSPKKHNMVPTRDLFERRGARLTLIVLIPAMVFLLVSAGIHVSTFGIDHTIIVKGQRKLVSGWPSALRVSLLSDDGHLFDPSHLAGYLVLEEKRHKLFGGSATDNGLALARNFKIPAVSPGPAILELDIQFDDKRRKVSSKVHLVSKPPSEEIVIPSDTNTKTQSAILFDDNLVQIFTEDRGAPTGLTSVMFLRSQNREGKPTSIKLETEIPKVPEKVFFTDRLGLVALIARPLELVFPVTVHGSRRFHKDQRGEAPSKAVDKEPDGILHPKVIYGGITASINNPIVSHGDTLRVSLEQVSTSGPVFADVFCKGQWIQTQSIQLLEKRGKMEISPSMPGLCRVQFTTSPLMPGKSVAVRHFYTLGKDEPINKGLKTILKELANFSDIDRRWAQAALSFPFEREAGFDPQMTGAFALSRLYNGNRIIETLNRSRNEDDAELAAFKSRIQRLIMIAIILLGLAVSFMIVLLARQSSRTHERISLMIMADESQAGDKSTNRLKSEPGDRLVTIIQSAIWLFIIVGTFTGIAVLIDTMTWWD